MNQNENDNIYNETIGSELDYLNSQELNCMTSADMALEIANIIDERNYNESPYTLKLNMINKYNSFDGLIPIKNRINIESNIAITIFPDFIQLMDGRSIELQKYTYEYKKEDTESEIEALQQCILKYYELVENDKEI